MTYQTLLDDYNAITGASTSAQSVYFVNLALRWAWGMDDSTFAWPQTLTSSSTVPVTSGVIAWTDVGSSDWVSFWRTDPRLPAGNIFPGIPYLNWGYNRTVPPVPVTWDGYQFNVQDSSISTPVFAFYRTAVPQATYGGSYTATVPTFFRDPVVRYAVAEYFASIASLDREATFRAKALDWFDSNKASILNSDAGCPWTGNVILT